MHAVVGLFHEFDPHFQTQWRQLWMMESGDRMLCFVIVSIHMFQTVSKINIKTCAQISGG